MVVYIFSNTVKSQRQLQLESKCTENQIADLNEDWGTLNFYNKAQNEVVLQLEVLWYGCICVFPGPTMESTHRTNINLRLVGLYIVMFMCVDTCINNILDNMKFVFKITSVFYSLHPFHWYP